MANSSAKSHSTKHKCVARDMIRQNRTRDKQKQQAKAHRTLQNKPEFDLTGDHARYKIETSRSQDTRENTKRKHNTFAARGNLKINNTMATLEPQTRSRKQHQQAGSNAQSLRARCQCQSESRTSNTVKTNSKMQLRLITLELRNTTAKEHNRNDDEQRMTATERYD